VIAPKRNEKYGSASNQINQLEHANLHNFIRENRRAVKQLFVDEQMIEASSHDMDQSEVSKEEQGLSQNDVVSARDMPQPVGIVQEI